MTKAKNIYVIGWLSLRSPSIAQGLKTRMMRLVFRHILHFYYCSSKIGVVRYCALRELPTLAKLGSANSSQSTRNVIKAGGKLLVD